MPGPDYQTAPQEGPLRKQEPVAGKRLENIEPTELLGHVLDTMPAGLLTVDADGVITSWNAELENLLGYRAAEVIGKKCSILGGNECLDGPCAPKAGRRCGLFIAGELSGKRCTLRSRKGQLVPVLKNARLMRDSQDKIVGGIESIIDLTGVVNLKREIAQLKAQATGRSRSAGIIGRHPRMQRVFEHIDLAGRMESSVLIQGETGTGKELVAQAVHDASSRRDGPFVRVNCAALPETLLESELFGHVRGAFTGAVADRKGRFEEAQGGTILLDEIGDAPASTQRKLLRVLQERELERVGNNRTIRLDIRVLAATNRDLLACCSNNSFRHDLYYRLNVIPIKLPPLRTRPEDIPLLTEYFISKLNDWTGRKVKGLAPGVLERLLSYSWPGNVRELENAMEYAFALAVDEVLDESCFPATIRVDRGNKTAAREALGALRTHYPGDDKMRRALEQCGGRRASTAALLGVSRVTLWKWLKARPKLTQGD